MPYYLIIDGLESDTQAGPFTTRWETRDWRIEQGLKRANTSIVQHHRPPLLMTSCRKP